MNSMKARIVERTAPDGSKKYVIQQRHWLFRRWWRDAFVRSLWGPWYNTSYQTLKEAREDLCYFDGTPSVDRVVSNEES